MEGALRTGTSPDAAQEDRASTHRNQVAEADGVEGALDVGANDGWVVLVDLGQEYQRWNACSAHDDASTLQWVLYSKCPQRCHAQGMTSTCAPGVHNSLHTQLLAVVIFHADQEVKQSSSGACRTTMQRRCSLCTSAARKVEQLAHGIHRGGVTGGAAGDAQAHAVWLVRQRRRTHPLHQQAHDSRRLCHFNGTA